MFYTLLWQAWQYREGEFDRTDSEVRTSKWLEEPKYCMGIRPRKGNGAGGECAQSPHGARSCMKNFHYWRQTVLWLVKRCVCSCASELKCFNDACYNVCLARPPIAIKIWWALWSSLFLLLYSITVHSL